VPMIVEVISLTR